MRPYLVTNGSTFWLLYGKIDKNGTPDPRETSRFIPQSETIEGLKEQLEAGLAALGQEPRPAEPFSYPVQYGMPGLPDVPSGGEQG